MYVKSKKNIDQIKKQKLNTSDIQNMSRKCVCKYFSAPSLSNCIDFGEPKEDYKLCVFSSDRPNPQTTLDDMVTTKTTFNPVNVSKKSSERGLIFRYLFETK
jgi:hypothetical protein